VIWIALAAATPLFPQPYVIAGLATESCATVFQAPNSARTAQWIAGFFSGLNATRGGQVGAQTDVAGLSAEVKLDCDREPSRPLVWAAQATYQRLSRR
jgi:hypothetical protein